MNKPKETSGLVEVNAFVNNIAKWMVNAKFVINKTDNDNYAEDVQRIMNLCMSTGYEVVVREYMRGGFELCEVAVNIPE